MSNMVLELESVTKSYLQGSNQIDIITDANLKLKAGELIGLVGPSGSGKSSLLHVAGLLDKASSGKVEILGTDYSNKSEKEKTLARNQHIGIIYQFHHLLADFTALENVMMPQLIAGVSKKQAQYKALELLDDVGLSHRVNHLPGELSGGEQQRVAIVRAIANNPKLLLADEPTGNLDLQSCDLVFDLLLKQIKINNLATIIITHNIDIAKKIGNCYMIKDRKLSKISNL